MKYKYLALLLQYASKQNYVECRRGILSTVSEDTRTKTMAGSIVEIIPQRIPISKNTTKNTREMTSSFATQKDNDVPCSLHLIKASIQWFQLDQSTKSNRSDFEARSRNSKELSLIEKESVKVMPAELVWVKAPSCANKPRPFK